jgi:hypothetical protein
LAANSEKNGKSEDQRLADRTPTTSCVQRSRSAHPVIVDAIAIHIPRAVPRSHCVVVHFVTETNELDRQLDIASLSAALVLGIDGVIDEGDVHRSFSRAASAPRVDATEPARTC